MIMSSCFRVPWNGSPLPALALAPCQEDSFSSKRAQEFLMKSHYGLEDVVVVKKRVIEHLAVLKLAGNDMEVLSWMFAWTSGVGKTSIGKSIAQKL